MSEWTEAGTEGRLTVWGRVEPEGPRWPTGGQVPWRTANRETDTAPLLDSESKNGRAGASHRVSSPGWGWEIGSGYRQGRGQDDVWRELGQSRKRKLGGPRGAWGAAGQEQYGQSTLGVVPQWDQIVTTQAGGTPVERKL